MVKTKEAMTDSMQTMRIVKHPFRADGNLIVVDDLEYGNLKIYEQTGEIALQIQQLFSEIDFWPGAALIAKMAISCPNRKDRINIDYIFCEYGHEELASAIIYQVIAFAEFYDGIRAVTISESEREKWFFYAGGILADFSKNQDGCYEYHVK
jgi:hypothetical protein